MFLNLDTIDAHLRSFMSNIELDLGIHKCNLNHGIDLEDNPQAIDYLCQRFSNIDGTESILQIPICSECMVALHSDYNILFLCIDCLSSQWLYRPEAKRYYDKNLRVLFFKSCPKCYGADN